MKARYDCEIACDCAKRANVDLHVGLCKEIFARKHTATHKPTSAQPLYSYQRDIHTRINRLWSPLAYGLGGNNRLWSPEGLRPSGAINRLWSPLAYGQGGNNRLWSPKGLRPSGAINPLPSGLSAGKSLDIKPEPQARVLYCLRFFSADKCSGSGVCCIHKKSR